MARPGCSLRLVCIADFADGHTHLATTVGNSTQVDITTAFIHRHRSASSESRDYAALLATQPNLARYAAASQLGSDPQQRSSDDLPDMVLGNNAALH